MKQAQRGTACATRRANRSSCLQTVPAPGSSLPHRASIWSGSTAGTAPGTRLGVPPLCPGAPAPALLRRGGELGKEKYAVRFSDPG